MQRPTPLTPGMTVQRFSGSAQLHRIRVDRGEAESLTEWEGDIYDACPLADGRVAVVAADEPTEEDQRRRAECDDAIVWSEQRDCSRLRLLDTVTRELHAAGDLSGRHVVEVAQRPDGGPIAVVSWVSREIRDRARRVRLASRPGPRAWTSVRLAWHRSPMARP
jgi:hypothetical protein